MRIAILFFLLLIGAAWTFMLTTRNRPTASGNSCINNLRQLEGAKEQWQLENKLTNGAPAIQAEVLQYMKGGVMPTCHAGGVYTLGLLGELPKCSAPGHKL